MNTKIIISTLVGAILLFGWQGLSWMVMPIHKHSLKYTDGQDSILQSLTANLDEDGLYYVPYLDPDKATSEDWEAFRKTFEGKPVAMINYIGSYQDNMGKTMAMGFIFSLIVSLVVTLVIANSKATSFAGRWLTAFAFGIVLLMFSTLMMMNWWYFPMHWVQGEIIDNLVMFGLAGIWYAWYLGRKPSAA